MVLEEAFKLHSPVNPQGLTSIHPSHGRRGKSVYAQINGHNTLFSMDFIRIQLVQGLSAIDPVSVEVENDTFLFANFEFSHDHALGYYDVQVETEKLGLISLEDAFELRESMYPRSSISFFPDTAALGKNFYLELHSQYEIFWACDSIYLQSSDGSQYYPWSTTHLNVETVGLFFKYESWIDSGYFDLVIKCDDEDIDMRLDDAFFIMDYRPFASLDTAYVSHSQQGWDVEIELCGEYTMFSSEVDVWLSQGGIDIIHAYKTSVVVFDTNCIKIWFDFPRDIPVGTYDLNTYDDYHGHLILTNSIEIFPGEPYLLSAPVGNNEICEGTSSTEYYVPMEDEFSDYQWSLDPENAGSITVDTGNTCVIAWEESFTGDVILTASAVGQFDSLFYSEPLEITIKKKPVLSFDYFSTGMKYTFINTSTGGLEFEWVYGVYSVQLYLSDEVCGSFTYTDSVRVVVDDVTNSFHNNFKLYPNPSAGVFTLERNMPSRDYQQIWVTDLQGRIILRDGFEPGKVSIRLSLQGIKSGLYLLNVRNGHVLWQEQIMILKQ